MEVEETAAAAKLKQEETENGAADKRYADSKMWTKPLNVKKLNRPAGWRGREVDKGHSHQETNSWEEINRGKKNLPQNKSILYILLKHTSPIKKKQIETAYLNKNLIIEKNTRRFWQLFQE